MPILNAYLADVRPFARFVRFCVVFLFAITLSACDRQQERKERLSHLIEASLADFRGTPLDTIPPDIIALDPEVSLPTDPLDLPPETREIRYAAQFDMDRFIDRPWTADSQVYFHPGTLLVTLAADAPLDMPTPNGLDDENADGLGGAGSSRTPTQEINSLFGLLALDGQMTPLTPDLWQLDFTKQGAPMTGQISPNLDFECLEARDTLDLAIITACFEQALKASGTFTTVERDFIFEPAYRLAAPAANIPEKQTGFNFTDTTPPPPRTLAVLTGPVWVNHPDLDGLDLVELDGINTAACNAPLGADGTPMARPDALNLTIMNRCGGRLSVLLGAMLDLSKGDPLEGFETNAVRTIAAPLSLARHCPAALQIALTHLADKNITFVAPSGDNGRPIAAISPAGCENTITVTPADFAGILTDGANYGADVDVMAYGGRLDDFGSTPQPRTPLVRQYAELCQSLNETDSQTVFACYDGWAEGSGLALMHAIDAFEASETVAFEDWMQTLTAPETRQCEAACEVYVGSTPIPDRGLCLRECGNHYLPRDP